MAKQQTGRRVGRPSKYDWDDKRDICHKLYVEEKKSASEIIRFFTEHFGVEASELPCRKGFIRQFNLWGFKPHRQKLSPDKQARVTARMKALWENNVRQKDIMHILNEEGHDIGKYDFGLLWKKSGFRLRNEQGYKAPDASLKKRKRPEVDNEVADDADNIATQPSIDYEWPTTQQNQHERPPTEAVSSSHDAAALRAQRLYELQIESDQKLQSGKRRRRIKGLGPLPADAPAAPRYASETSLDECKAYLHLSNEMYLTIRADFETICHDLNIVKKTQCAEGVWEESKNRLVRENLHLSAMLHPLQPEQEKKAIALDCICTDVTKRIRASGRIVTIAQANNCLGLNPMASKAIRRSLYEILESNNFESRMICGEARWSELRQMWFDTSRTLLEAMNGGDATQAKSVDVLCRDTLKRFRDDKIRSGERAVMHSSSYGPGPGPARPAMTTKGSNVSTPVGSSHQNSASQSRYPIKTPIREPRVRAAVEGKGYYAHPSGNLLMSLAQATGNIDFEIDPALGADSIQATPNPHNTPVSAYFSLDPDSRVIGNHPRMWLGTLTSVSIHSLHRAAVCKAGAATVAKVCGLIMNSDGLDDSRSLENREELATYLHEAGETPRFVVLLQGGYA